MLVLSRKLNEAIVIDGGITLTVVAVKGKTVRLAIDAPPFTRVDRQEVYERLIRDGFFLPDDGPEFSSSCSPAMSS
jgi:carbon storage regulator